MKRRKNGWVDGSGTGYSSVGAIPWLMVYSICKFGKSHSVIIPSRGSSEHTYSVNQDCSQVAKSVGQLMRCLNVLTQRKHVFQEQGPDQSELVGSRQRHPDLRSSTRLSIAFFDLLCRGFGWIGGWNSSVGC